MALGKRKLKEQELFIATNQIVRTQAHPFYKKLNQVFDQCGFDDFVEELCEPYYAKKGRPGIPPGIYFRMILIGYFEGLDSQRGVAWRCNDSLSLREFLGLDVTEPAPVHASMTIIRQRLPQKVFDEFFVFVLKQLQENGLVKGKTIGIDATTLEANAAMKSLERRADHKDWQEYLEELAKAEGIENPSKEDLQRLDRGRKKKVSNKEWQSRTDSDSRIGKMKDGRTHMLYKAEHSVDLETEAILNSHVTYGDRGDTATGPESVTLTQVNLNELEGDLEVKEVVMDKGYHSTELLAECETWGLRTYLPEPKRKRRKWRDKAPELEGIYRANRRRAKGTRGKKLNRKRSEYCERTFAHVCETGGSRKTWLRGLEHVEKIHSLKCAAFNIGLLMRKVFGLSKPRNWESSRAAALAAAFLAAFASGSVLSGSINRETGFAITSVAIAVLLLTNLEIFVRRAGFLKNRVY